MNKKCALPPAVTATLVPGLKVYTKLAEEVERLIDEQRKRQQQLEQSSDASKHAPF